MQPVTDHAPDIPQGAITRHSFVGVDDFTGAMADWNLDFRQLRGDDPRVHVQQIAGSEAIV